MTASPFNQWAEDRRNRFSIFAERKLPSVEDIPQRLHEAMRYAVLDGGKRVRPLLVYAAAELTGARESDADLAALAVECVHSYSLIHDDMPCMDNDLMRHGKPSVHAKYGEAWAMLAGDALQPEAFLFLTELSIPNDQKIQVMRQLAYASSTRGMCGGQAIDLDSVGKKLSYKELREMHVRKTGALLEASVLMGAYLGRKEFLTDSLLSSVSTYGKAIGLAFQVVDDILDATADSTVLGKTAGKDLKDDKPTYVTSLGLDEARRMAKELHDQAVQAIEGLSEIENNKSYRLIEIADYIIRRSY